MIFKEQGERTLPPVLLVHGGGLSDWSWDAVAARLSAHHHVITVVLDGHGDAAEQDFVSIEAAADSLFAYIQDKHGGHVFAIAGLSIGAQIVCELLCKAPDIAQYAVLESALAVPITWATGGMGALISITYPLLKNRRFAKLQARALGLPPHLWEQYFRDSARMSKQTLVNITTSNAAFVPKPELAQTQAKVWIAVGQKERNIIKRSAQRLRQMIPHSVLYIVPDSKHGQWSLCQAQDYAARLMAWFGLQHRK